MRHLSLLLILMLAACMGGGGGGNAGGTLSERPPDDNVTDPGSLPTSGTARYAGDLTARLPLGPGGTRQVHSGDMVLNVDFGATRDQVTGRVTGLAPAQGTPLDGSLRIASGRIFRDTDPDQNYTFNAGLGGRLARGSDRFVIDGKLAGEFRGRDRGRVTGVVYGDITGPAGEDIFDGDFAASRD